MAWSEIPTAIAETLKWLNSASARKKEQALKAADAYIDIDSTGLYQGEELTEERERKLKLHFSKRFNAWKNGEVDVYVVLLLFGLLVIASILINIL